MAITDTAAGAANNSNNVATYTSTSVAWTANNLIICLACISDTVLDAAFSDDGTGEVWELLVGEQFTSGVTMMGYIAIRQTLADSANRITSMNVTGDNGTGCHMAVRQLGGARSSPPYYRQVAFATGASGTTPTVPLKKACKTNNAVFGFVVGSGAAPSVSPPSGWGEILDQGHINPNQSFEYARILSGETGSTITWGSTIAADWFAGVIEIYEANEPVDGKFADHHRKLMMGAF